MSKKIKQPMETISGVKREKTQDQGTGATRSDRTGKGRFDLIPPVAWDEFDNNMHGSREGNALVYLSRVKGKGDLQSAIGSIMDALGGPAHAMIRLALRYEGGAACHGDNNWLKGLPVSRCLDAARRHLCQALAGLTDEDHLAAALWNCVAMLHFWDTPHNDLKEVGK